MLQEPISHLPFILHCTQVFLTKVCVQGVVALGGHFRTLSMQGGFIAFFFIINFQTEKSNTFTLLIILIMKSLQIELL